MSLSVIDKYVEKKKKDILEYAKILESLITLENNKMWSRKENFLEYSKEIITIYADKYYFANNEHRDNPILYANDNINNVLEAIIDYCKNNNKQNMLSTLKNETFLLSVIICTACYLDIATNVIDGDFLDTKNKFKYLLSYFTKTNILQVACNDRMRINELFSHIKNNIVEDKKFFACFTDPNYKNIYTCYTKDPLYYKVEFEYSIKGLEKFDKVIVEDIRKNMEPKLLSMSYDLLMIHLLEELISNRENVKYLVCVNKIFNKRPSILNVFDNKYAKEYIKVLIPLEQEMDYNDALQVINKKGIGVIYLHEDIANVDDNKFNYDIEIIVNEEFLKNNEENKYAWSKKGVKFVIKNKED